ncbi:ribosome maturation factor RimP [Viridibacillus sp. FSL E2-0187]|jgi:ribosome maturation factor RimP|uniref:Ribosome maturation factor RimP n=1 Tax=Viridibacillus arvi TaxID=263475 RepID=A0A0M0LEV8_9BACL|nr:MULTISPECIES: ribosome maturation factor RimP [Viridibacillus]KOO49253.1 ribosome maturation protein RimP [Viridibacillus arvi]QOV10853.1 ribosome maturation factor RimP [Viridibacillus sp. JNUCC-6]
MSKVISAVEQLATPIVEGLNLELVEVEFVKEGRDWFLRVYIDTPEGSIDIEQCAQVSELLSLKLDESDPIEQNYFLEVSSPGAERPLKKEADFEKAIGQFVHIKSYEAINGMKVFEGYLRSYTDAGVELDVKIKTRKIKVVIDKDKIALARLAIDFSAES